MSFSPLNFFIPGVSGGSQGSSILTTTWAARPAPGSPGRVIRVSDVGPAPGIEMIDSGTRWRPRGGQQVVARRGPDAAVTVQNATLGTTIEQALTFPAGMVRAGMQIRTMYKVDHSGIGTGTQAISTRVRRPNLSFVAGSQHQMVESGASLLAVFEDTLDIISDTDALHVGTWGNSGGGASWTSGQVRANAQFDTSQPFGFWFLGNSSNETATNITSVSWSGGLATFVNPNHTLNTGDRTTVAGVSVAGYNGLWTVNSRIDANTWTAAMTDPGAAGTGGTSSRISNLTLLSYVVELIG